MQDSPTPNADFLTLADIVGVYGIKGWVRLRLRLDDPALLDQFSNLYLYRHSSPSAGDVALTRTKVHIDTLQRQGKGFIAHLDVAADRTAAEALVGSEIGVPEALFPKAMPGDYYWRDLVGLEVWCTEGDDTVLLGAVKRLMETGANDVLVVEPSETSVDTKEHLVPWIPDQVVTDVDLERGRILVDWYVDL